MISLRIHDISLKSNAIFQEPGYGFIEDCKNVYNLPQDNSFGWGNVADGSLTVPTNEDYITVTGIPTGSSWHGPNFVHVLDQPIRLFELSDFAVTGGTYQSEDDERGQMRIALFDENMQIVMLVYWKDAWSDSKKSEFYITFYSESSGGKTENITDITDDLFIYTARMWYEDGTIKYEFEALDKSRSGDLGTVDNPYRLIKYVVVNPQRYGNDDMVELRLHQLSVTSNFRTPTEEAVEFTAPVITISEPTSGDGTIGGSFDTDNPPPEVQSWLDTAQTIIDQIISWWVVWWPRLHMYFTFTTSAGGLAILHFSIDILGDLRAEETDFYSPIFDLLSENDRNIWSESVCQQVSQTGPFEDGFRILTIGAINIIGVMCSFLGAAYALPGGGLVAVAALLGVAEVTWTVWLYSLMIAHSLGLISTGFTLAMIGAFGFGLVGSEAIFGYIVRCLAWSLLVIKFSKEALKGVGLATWLCWNILGALVQMCMFVYSYYIYWELIEYSVLNYIEGMAT